MAILGSAVQGVAGCSGCGGEGFHMTVLYNPANTRVVVVMNREMESGEQLYVQTRRGKFGQLDCAALAAQVAPVDGATGPEIDGPPVEAALTKPFYGPEWGEGNPTPEMLASLENGTDSIIDVCLMNGSKVVHGVERDLFAAWDAGRKRGFGGKADEPGGEQRINSPQEYGVRCVGELGEIPFFEKTGDGTYSTSGRASAPATATTSRSTAPTRATTPVAAMMTMTMRKPAAENMTRLRGSERAAISRSAR
jgi:hypothetical protein